MAEAEVRQLVKNGESTSGLVFEDPAIRFVISVANGLPYLASLISHHAGLAAIDAGRTVVTADDVSKAITEALAELKGRISKRSQLQIAGVVRDGAHKILGALAGAAQLNGGVIDADEISVIWPGLEGAARCKTLVARLAEEGTLVGLQEDDFGRRYTFLEDSVPPYLWLLVAHARFLEGERSTVVAMPSDRHAAAEG